MPSLAARLGKNLQAGSERQEKGKEFPRSGSRKTGFVLRLADRNRQRRKNL
nr:MAG TPA: hypothetical protein [Inoviridae sp.]